MNKLFSRIFLVLSTLALISATAPPVIAILANSQPDDAVDIQGSRVNYQYVRWLEQSRAQVLVIQPWYTEAEIEDILSKVNGVLWQGGDRNLVLSGQFETAAKLILEKIIYYKDVKNISIPLWGTCQGFELLHALLANNLDVLTHFRAENIKTPVVIDELNLKTSRMFSDFSDRDLYNIQNLNVTAQFHQFGVSNEQYSRYPILNEFFEITSHGIDLDGKYYISSVEGKRYPVYALQFHPEMVSYTKENINGVPQSMEAMKISQLFSNFFVSQALMNNRTMSSEDMNKYEMISAYDKLPVYQENYYFYFFEKKTKTNLEFLIQ